MAGGSDRPVGGMERREDQLDWGEERERGRVECAAGALSSSKMKKKLTREQADFFYLFLSLFARAPPTAHHSHPSPSLPSNIPHATSRTGWTTTGCWTTGCTTAGWTATTGWETKTPGTTAAPPPLLADAPPAARARRARVRAVRMVCVVGGWAGGWRGAWGREGREEGGWGEAR